MGKTQPKVKVSRADVPEVLSDEGVDELIEAVVKKAMLDYTKALNRQKNAYGIDKANATRRVKECERFFKSPWGLLITYGYGEMIIEIIRKRVGVDNDG